MSATGQTLLLAGLTSVAGGQTAHILIGNDDARINFGVSQDAWIYRSGPGTLKTENLLVNSDLTV